MVRVPRIALRRLAIGSGVLAMLILLVPLAAGGRTLPPAAVNALQGAFGSAPQFRIRSIEVYRSTALVRFCATADAAPCFAVRLDDPEQGCDGDAIGPWCVHWAEGSPQRPIRDAVLSALRESPSHWIATGPSPLPTRNPVAAKLPGDIVVAPWVLGLGLFLGPLLLGIGCGIALRRLRWRRYGQLLAPATAMVLATLLVASVPAVSAWDIVSLALLLIAGMALAAAGVDARAGLVLTISSVLGLAALEWAVRRWLPPPPEFPAPAEASFILAPGTWDIGCGPLFGADVDQAIAALRSPPRPPIRTRGPLVVHLGDSMTFGHGVTGEAAFPTLLDERHPEVAHANYGVSAVGTDYEYLLLQRILSAHAPAFVVLHVFLGNDIYEIDRPYECCASGPLLDYQVDGPVPRCSSARPGIALARYLGRSPPPYPLRVATGWSAAARHVAAAFSQITVSLDLPPNFIKSEVAGSEQGWAHFAQILAAMRDQLAARDIGFVVDLIPNRAALEVAAGGGAPPAARSRAAAIAASLGVATIDPWDLLTEAVRRGGSRRYFLGEHDVHFTLEGHRLMADWLDSQLPAPNAAASGGRP